MNRQELREAARELTVVEGLNLSDAFLNTWINQSLHEIGTYARWRWLQETTTVTTVAGTQTYALPGDFQQAIALVDDDNDKKVPHISPARFLHLYGNDTGNSGPTALAWTAYEGNIYLHPIPSTNDTNRYTLYYYENPATLSDDATQVQFHTSFHWAIVEWLKWKIWEREEYFEQAEASRQAYFLMMDRMQTWYNNVVEQEPTIWGDGHRLRIHKEPNIPSLDSI